MNTLDFVALSLLPSARRRAAAALSALAAERLDAPDALELLIGYCARDEPDPVARAEHLRAEAGAILKRAGAIEPVAWSDPRFPPSLRTIADAPVVLWAAGDPCALAGTAVAVVGSRAASPYGLEVAERLGRQLASAGLTVVSGLARGCDAAAHRGALAAGGCTVAVLGCGVNVAYPAEHKGLADEVRAAGVLVSELPPGAPPLAAHFPLRNRIISGLSRAVVVVEASEKSGSLITAACALEQGRDVMAVPGSVFGTRNRGSHALLRDGARLVESAEDVLQELGLAAGAVPGSASGAQAKPKDPLLSALAPGEDCDVAVLADRTGLSPSVLLSRLLALELDGNVRRLPGGRFVRSGR